MNLLKEYGITDRYKSEATMHKSYTLGRVINQNKDKYKVVTDNKEVIAEVSGKFRYEVNNNSEFPVVGDFVMLDILDDSSVSIIHHVLTRKSIFSRAIAGKTKDEQIIATNIDIVFICMSLNNNYNLNRLERYLAVAWDSMATPVIVLTKSDLCDDVESIVSEVEVVSMYSDIVVTNIYDDSITTKLSKYLTTGTTAAFVGSSGVGKSTIINKLTENDINMETKEVDSLDKGKHTTTGKYMFKTIYGGAIIDTPGMRELGILNTDVDVGFNDISDIANNCKYSNCTHTNEPGCAILKAIEDGILDDRRVQNYIKMKNESSYEGLSAKEIEVKKHERMFSSVGGMKNARNFIKQNKKR